MTIQEQEALARQLWNIFDESWPSEYLTWEELPIYQRTAWIMVAQFVVQRDKPFRDFVEDGSSKYIDTKTTVHMDWNETYPDHR